jgi:hypothetical protein
MRCGYDGWGDYGRGKAAEAVGKKALAEDEK